MAAIIFDFDGTIADSFEVIVDIFEHITKRPERLSEKQIAELRGYSLQTVAERLHIPRWRLPFLLTRGRRMMSRRIDEVPVFEGVPKIFEELQAEGHELFIVSSNSSRNIKKFLKRHHLYTYFTDIKGSTGLLGKSRAIKSVVRANSFDIKDCVYVGDETRDILAAKTINMRIIAVCWGFANAEFLQSLHPTALAHEPQDIIRILEEL